MPAIIKTIKIPLEIKISKEKWNICIDLIYRNEMYNITELSVFEVNSLYLK
jgi:hypothetical protein